MLFLEICGSFSESRRDLCSSYFYCRSNSLEENVICKKALFLSALLVKLNRPYWAEARGRWGTRGNLHEASWSWTKHNFSLTCGVVGYLDMMLLLSAQCPSSVFLFSWMQNAQRQREDKQDGRENPLEDLRWKKRVAHHGDFHDCFQGAPGWACIRGAWKRSSQCGFRAAWASLAMRGTLGAVADVPIEESVRLMRLWDWVARPAGQSSARAGWLSPSTYTRPFPVSKHRMFFSSRTCLSLKHLFITSTDMWLGTSCCQRES